MKALFEPCRKADHAHCTRAYFDAAGESVSCGCSCHVQAGLFAAEKPCVQPDLFGNSTPNPANIGKDTKSGLKLSLIGSNA